MQQNSNIQHRAKHFDLLLARKLAFIEREHYQNLLLHQKLENSIRRASLQSSNVKKPKFIVPFETSSSLSHHTNNKDRRTSNACSTNNQTRVSSDHFDELSDDSLSSVSFRTRLYTGKNQRLPSITKINKQKSTYQWLNPFQEMDSFSNQTNKTILPEISPIQKQIRSFLDRLPRYEGIQRGFDSFAPASLYTNRAPVIIR